MNMDLKYRDLQTLIDFVSRGVWGMKWNSIVSVPELCLHDFNLLFLKYRFG